VRSQHIPEPGGRSFCSGGPLTVRVLTIRKEARRPDGAPHVGGGIHAPLSHSHRHHPTCRRNATEQERSHHTTKIGSEASSPPPPSPERPGSAFDGPSWTMHAAAASIPPPPPPAGPRVRGRAVWRADRRDIRAIGVFGNKQTNGPRYLCGNERVVRIPFVLADPLCVLHRYECLAALPYVPP